MRKLILGLSALAVAVPTAVSLPVASAEAKVSTYKADTQRRRAQYREWRGKDGRTYCRKPDGTTGIIVGGIAGALVGRTIDTRGDRAAGTLLGAAAGALAGREIDRNNVKNSRARYCR